MLGKAQVVAWLELSLHLTSPPVGPYFDKT
jgi:hypothetical protein